MIHIYVSVRQNLSQSLHVSPFCGWNKGGTAKAIRQFRICSGSNSEFQDIEKSLSPSIQEGIIEHIVTQIDVRAGLNQSLNGGDAVAMCGSHDGSATTSILSINAGSVRKQPHDGGSIPCFSSPN